MTLENDIRIVTTQTQANNEDWPNLAYYHNNNISLGSPIENEKRIVFMGDSITEEWGYLYSSFFSNPSVTPITMLLIRDRKVPVMALASRLSSFAATLSNSPS